MTSRTVTPPDRRVEPIRTGLSVEAIRRAFLDNLFYIQARFREVATPNDFYEALAYTVRDRLLARWIRTAEAFKDTRARTVCYFSAEFLLGPQLGSNLLNLGIMSQAREAMALEGLAGLGARRAGCSRSWPRRRAWPISRRPCRRRRSTPRPWTASSTRASTSCRAWAISATACSGRN